MSQTTYSAAALATELNVPRTTINDWLNRYADYIDTIAVGKRKVYSQESLEVLKTIANLRDNGKSGAEIEQFLAQNHGIRPEVAPEVPAEKPAVDSAEDQQLPAAPEKSSNGENLPALQNIERSALELTSFIADLREQQQKSAQRARKVSLLLWVMIVMMLAAFALIYMFVRSEFTSRKNEAEIMAKNLRQLNSELAAMEKARAQERAAAEQKAYALQDKLNDLNSKRSAMDAEMKKLNAQLANMDKALRQAGEKAAAQEKARLQEIAALQRSFAAERDKWQQILQKQQQVLQEKDVLHRKELTEKLSAEAAASQQRMNALQEKLDSLDNELKKLNAQPAASAMPPQKTAQEPTAEKLPK